MLDFDFSEKDKEKYYRKAEERLLEAGITFIKPDRGAIGARNYDCTTHKAEVVIVHMTTIPKSKLTRQKLAMLRKVKGWRMEKPAVPANGWRGHTMTPEVPDYAARSRIEFTDGRGRHGAKG